MKAFIAFEKPPPHSECLHGSVWATVKDGRLTEEGHRVGEVRYCRHGKIILCYQVGYTTRTIHDARTPLWRTLSPFWNPKLHKRALAALEKEEQNEEEAGK